jgi:hypothetical protein
MDTSSVSNSLSGVINLATSLLRTYSDLIPSGFPRARHFVLFGQYCLELQSITHILRVIEKILKSSTNIPQSIGEASRILAKLQENLEWHARTITQNFSKRSSWVSGRLSAATREEETRKQLAELDRQKKTLLLLVSVAQLSLADNLNSDIESDLSELRSVHL